MWLLDVEPDDLVPLILDQRAGRGELVNVGGDGLGQQRGIGQLGLQVRRNRLAGREVGNPSRGAKKRDTKSQ